MSQYSIKELCGCVRREIGQRKRVYRRLVKEQKMEPGEALEETRMMEAVLENLEEQEQARLF